MKKLLFVLLLYSSAYAQQIVEKYNSFNQRYEYFNSSGVMVGYKVYDSFNNSWNYYDASQQSKYNAPERVDVVGIKTLQNTMSTMQQRYDNNVAQIDNALIDIKNQINRMSCPESQKNVYRQIIQKVMANVGSQRINFSDNNVTRQIINALYDSVNDEISRQNLALENNRQNYSPSPQSDGAPMYPTSTSRQSNSNPSTYLLSEGNSALKRGIGGYTCNHMTEEKFNANTMKYNQGVTKSNQFKLYIDQNGVYVYKPDLRDWKKYTVSVSDYNSSYITLRELSTGNIIEIDKAFTWIIISENKIGDNYYTKYTFRNLNKAPITKPN